MSEGVYASTPLSHWEDAKDDRKEKSPALVQTCRRKLCGKCSPPLHKPYGGKNNPECRSVRQNENKREMTAIKVKKVLILISHSSHDSKTGAVRQTAVCVKYARRCAGETWLMSPPSVGQPAAAALADRSPVSVSTQSDSDVQRH